MARLRAKRVRALLGPTNTGKTHRAIEAMLRHKSGMFGLPLRLLAREVYDRVSAATSPDQVALITGEEKVVPEQPRYWICTVEAMPVDQRVAFVGIDEVQLAEDRQRGHVFTDRLLHSRGLEETIFMGSDRMSGLIAELVPEAEVERAPRFSQLTRLGPHSVRSLPKRSAVVAFSTEQVYSLAERLKAVHGGAAVVLGALSPRTRNAQVELYQSGRVKHLVATDAIGMGLNLDLHHVALAADRKYDGRGFRALTAAEVGQIVGRAGRYKTDGTFGAVSPLHLDDDLAEAVELHRFAPVKRLFWRNSHLQLDSVEALLTSLELRPQHPALRPLRNLEDEHALVVLARDPVIAERAVGREAVARLWEVCQVPDFRKTLTDAHLRLLRELALHRLGRGVLPDSWVADRIDRLDRTEGDIETLMSRIAWIRTWTYVAYRPDWIEDRLGWQERTRAIEDRLSDALHQALTARFVDPLRQTARRLEDVSVEGDRICIGGVEAATLVGLDVVAEHGLPGGMRTAVQPVIRERLQALLDEGGLEVDREHRITWKGSVLAVLQPGPTVLEPKIRVRRLELLSGVDKNRLTAHLEQWVRGTIEGLVQRLAPAKRHSAGVRGVLYQLTQGLGSVSRSTLVTAIDALDQDERRDLARAGVRIGLQVVYLPASLKPRALAIRARLWCVRHGVVPTWRAPSGTAAWAGDRPEVYWNALGFHLVGQVAVRADVLEAAAAELREEGRRGPFELPDGVVSRLALGTGAAHVFVVGLGYRHREGRYHPPRRGTGRR